MPQQVIHVSERGLDILRDKLAKATAELKSIREEKAIAYTATGDTWHDNPYFNKLEQDERNKEAEIANLNDQIANARIFTIEQRNTARVQLGSIVHVSRYFKVSGSMDEQVWEIVGYGETDAPQRKVAYNAPFAQAIIGLGADDTAEAQTPQGAVEYEVIKLFSNWEAVPAELKQ